jgi:PAS domain S-box-containing protein
VPGGRRWAFALVEGGRSSLYGERATKGAVVAALDEFHELGRVVLGKTRRVRVRDVLAFVLVAGTYIGAAKLGLELSVAHGVITPVWPPTGIALAALVILGPRFWPAVALGAFVSNATSGVSIEVAAVISIGNTLEALAGVYLLRRVGFRPSLERGRDVLALAVLAAFVSTTLAATNGVTTLAIAGSAAASPYGSAWVLWWLGDAMGDLLVAPLLLIWATRPPKLDRTRTLEALTVFALLAGVSSAIFLGGLWRYPYPIFPLLVWATLRFRQLGAATGSFVVAAIAVAGVVAGETPLGGDLTTKVQVLQALLAFVAVSLLVLGATLSEREQANESLAEAQQLAHLGSWEWEITSDRVAWSSELFRIFGVDPRADALTFESFLDHVHPDDRARVRAEVERALAARHPFEVNHRIVLDNGTERAVHSRGRVVVDAAGVPNRMVGTAQDVTERRRLEEVRDNILSAVSHELRTPLTSILGFALTLRERPELDAAVRQQITDELATQAEKLERLLLDLLDVDRLRYGLVKLACERTDIAALVERVAAAINPDCSIDVHAAPLVADVDPAKVERIIENLLANAIKHTPPGTKIAASVAQTDEGLLICVDDAGPGIPDEQKKEVFELFTRGNNAADTPGTGIGLALVAQFAALHGGKAWVQDNADGGASFRVLLPLRAPSKP